MSRGQPIEGKRFGRLVVVALNKERSTPRRKYYDCLCDCGGAKVALRGNLVGGKTTSCGCYQKESATSSINKNRKRGELHGDSKTRLYTIWQNMLNRCRNENIPEYYHYGARGITVCEEWAQSYLLFKQWAIQHGYDDSLTIDRIDCNGNYDPSNCRWVDMKVQANNKRNNKRVEINGIVKTESQWAHDSGVSRGVIARNIRKGLTEDDILTNKRKLKPSTGEKYIYFKDEECTKYRVQITRNGRHWQSKTLLSLEEAKKERDRLLEELINE